MKKKIVATAYERRVRISESEASPRSNPQGQLLWPNLGRTFASPPSASRRLCLHGSISLYFGCLKKDAWLQEIGQ